MFRVAFNRNDDTSLYIVKVNTSSLGDSFGLLSIKSINRNDNNIWYQRYASDQSIADDSILVPSWMSIWFQEGEMVTLEQVTDPKPFPKEQEIEILYFPLTPLPCALDTTIGFINNQLQGQVVFPGCVLPLMLLGQLIFVQANVSNMGIITKETLITCHNNDNDNSDNGWSHHDKCQFNEILGLHLRATLSQRTKPKKPDSTTVLILRGFSIGSVKKTIQDLSFELYNVPIGLLIEPASDLEQGREEGEIRIKTVTRWINDIVQKKTKSPIFMLVKAQFLSSKTLLKFQSIVRDYANQNVGFLLLFDNEETANTISTLFPSASIVRNEEKSLFSKLEAFKIDLLMTKEPMALSKAQQIVKEEMNMIQADRLCSALPLGLSSWSDIYGYELVKGRIQKILYGAINSTLVLKRLGIKDVRGILLYGPSGCGKSEMIKAIANDGIFPVLKLRSTDILSKYLGESEARLRRAFSEARNMTPCILFIDNIDILGAKRGKINYDT